MMIATPFSLPPVLLLLLAGCVAAQIDPQRRETLTVYHVNQKNYSDSDIRNMNVASAAGDLYFDLRSRILPIECADDPHQHDCYNPEVNSTVPLTVTKIELELDNRYAPYSRCNINSNNGSYTCECPEEPCLPNVGREYVAPHFCNDTRKPPKRAANWQWWRYNMACKAGGLWYSMPDVGECSDPPSKPCFWRVMNVTKRIYKDCHDAVMNTHIQANNPDCFNSCAQPHNATSTCWIQCFYDTVLGKGSDAGPLVPGAGLALNTLIDYFDLPFQASSAKESGCPNI